MLSWLLIIILAYFLFGVASFGDKLVLNHSQNPKLYIFYVGFLSLLAVLFIPFFGILLPGPADFFWIILTSIAVMAGLYFLYYTIEKFEVSRVVPLVGAMQPIFVLLVTFLFSPFGGFNINNLLAFFILLIAGIIISVEGKFNLNGRIIKLSLIASFLIGLSFVLIKTVFLSQPFINGIIWIGIFNFLIAMALLLDSELRKSIFVSGVAFNKKTIALVFATQSAGGLGGVLQNLAIYLAPFSSLAIINALRGVQYAFLFIIALFFSHFFPKILREDISKKVIIQKVISIILIILGLYILVLT